MGHKHSREEILTGAVDVAMRDGISNLTFGRLANHLSTSDRVIVYYFPSKTALITEVLLDVGGALQDVLAQSLPREATGYHEMAKVAYRALAREEFDPLLRLHLEAWGLAAAGIAPFDVVAAGLTVKWVDWLAGLFKGTPTHRKAQAESTLALIDGVMLMRQVSGHAAADRIASALRLR